MSEIRILFALTKSLQSQDAADYNACFGAAKLSLISDICAQNNSLQSMKIS